MVRTWDTYGVRVDWDINEDAATGAMITVVLPDHSVWNPDESGMFAGCDPDTSSISDDGHTLVCDLGDRPEGSHGTIRPIATLQLADDNTTFNVTATLTTDDDPNTGVTDQLDQPLTVSEAPAGDWIKKSPAVSQVVNNGTEEGYVAIFPLALADKSKLAQKGAGPISEIGPIVFNDHAWSLTPSARLATPAELNMAGFAGTVCGTYAGSGPLPTTTETWTCDPATSPNGYPVVPITVSGYSTDPAPATNADGSPNDDKIVITGQIGFWLPKAEVDAAIADPSDGSNDGTKLFNTISLDPDATTVNDPANITPIQIPGTSGPVDETTTANNTATVPFSTNGGKVSVDVAMRFNHHGNFGPPLRAQRFQDGSDPISVVPSSPNFSTANWKGDGEVSRNTPLSMHLALHTSSLDRSEPIHGCMAWRNEHIDLIDPPSFTTVNLYEDPKTEEETTANFGAAQVYYGRSVGSRVRPATKIMPFPTDVKANLEVIVEFAASADPFAVDVADNEQTCNNSDADTRGWVASTADLSGFQTSPGKYGDINMVRVRTVGDFPWSDTRPEIEPAANYSSLSAINLTLWATAGSVLSENPNGSTLYMHTSRAHGDWNPATEDAPANLSCLGDDNDSNLAVPSYGWCSQSYSQAQENPASTGTQLDPAGFTTNPSGLFQSDSDHDKLTIVEAVPGIEKVNVDGASDVKNNGQLVQFTLSPSIVGSPTEALTNVRVTDQLPEEYKFVRVVTEPTTPGASCTLPAVGSSGTITCQLSEPDPNVDSDPDLPAGLPGGWSDSFTIEVQVSGGEASVDELTEIENTAQIDTSAVGSWDPATDQFNSPLAASPKSDEDTASSYLPLAADEGFIVKAIAEEEGPCLTHPTAQTVPDGRVSAAQ